MPGICGCGVADLDINANGVADCVETNAPSAGPSATPSKSPTVFPSTTPSQSPSDQPSTPPSFAPSNDPSQSPSDQPSTPPSSAPSSEPSHSPSHGPSMSPSAHPSDASCAAIDAHVCDYEKDENDETIMRAKKWSLCRVHIKDNQIDRYSNECVDSSKLGSAGPGDFYDGDKVILNCGCCEGQIDDSSVSIRDGKEIEDHDKDYCVNDDCYFLGAPVCDAKDSKVSICYDHDGDIKTKCEDPWWRPTKSNQEFQSCGECTSNVRRGRKLKGQTMKNIRGSI